MVLSVLDNFQTERQDKKQMLLSQRNEILRKVKGQSATLASEPSFSGPSSWRNEEFSDPSSWQDKERLDHLKVIYERFQPIIDSFEASTGEDTPTYVFSPQALSGQTATSCFHVLIPLIIKETDEWLNWTESDEHKEATRHSEGKEFEEAIKFFKENRGKILKKYEGKFIAIINNKVVDSDEDFSVLAERVYEKFGYRSIYMPKVTKEPEVLHIPTPFLRK